MAVLATAVWRVRVSGNELNGGGFDSTISGAGTDYTDQDSSQLSLTDFATSGAGSTTLTSATGGFTSAMVGNCIRIASGTNFQTGYYFVTGYTDTNTVTLDRTPTSGGAGSGGTGRLGGAWASIVNVTNGGSGPSPLISTPIVAGNSIYIRGAGTDNPTVVDYDWDSGYWTAPNGSSTLPITMIGYNGRPLIGHTALLIFGASHWAARNIAFKQTATGFEDYGVFSDGSTFMDECSFDVAGYDARVTNGALRRCTISNSGSTSSGTRTAVHLPLGGWAIDCKIINQRNHGIQVKEVYGGHSIKGCIVAGCNGDGIYSTESTFDREVSIESCTIDNNGGHGLNFATTKVSVRRSLISNHTGSGKKGLNYSGSSGAASLEMAIDNNFYGNTTNSNITLDSSNTTLNPTYTGSGDYTPGNSSLLVSYQVGEPGTSTGANAVYDYLGAANPQSGGGGGGLAIPVSGRIIA